MKNWWQCDSKCKYKASEVLRRISTFGYHNNTLVGLICMCMFSSSSLSLHVQSTSLNTISPLKAEQISILSTPHSSHSPSPPHPIPHMLQNNPRPLLRTMLPPHRLHKIALRIHQIEINTMIDQIILTLFDALRRTEINPIFLTHLLDLIPRSRQAYQSGVEFREVGLENRGRVARRVAGYEDGEEGGEGWSGRPSLGD